MSRPVLFVIDDDAGVVRALQGDLGRRFGEDFRVIGESSVAAGGRRSPQEVSRRSPQDWPGRVFSSRRGVDPGILQDFSHGRRRYLRSHAR
jgi:hypothetical protein